MPDVINDQSTYPLGDVVVRRLGYGAMQLPGPGVMGPPKDHGTAVKVVRRAVELGVNHIDTAQYYGPDVANELIQEALHPYSQDLALVSKVGARRTATGAWVAAQKPSELRSAVEDNLRTLQVERLAAVNLRLMDHHVGIEPPALEDQLAEMVALRDAGKIAGIGISNASPAQVKQAIDSADIVCVQNPYSLLDRTSKEVLDLCSEAGVAFVPFFPLGSAFPGMPKVVDHPGVRAVAERRRVTPAQIGLAWLLANRPNILLIPGTSSISHLEENLSVGDIALTPEEIAELEGTPVGD